MAEVRHGWSISMGGQLGFVVSSLSFRSVWEAESMIGVTDAQRLRLKSDGVVDLHGGQLGFVVSIGAAFDEFFLILNFFHSTCMKPKMC